MSINKTGSSVEDFLSFQPDPAIHGKRALIAARRVSAQPNPRISIRDLSGENHQYPDLLKLCRFGPQRNTQRLTGQICGKPQSTAAAVAQADRCG